MGELIDKAKGKGKEIGGVLSGDRELESEGKADQLKGEAKGKFEQAKQDIKQAGKDLKERIESEKYRR